jgi:predicted anti-sigma-YlaC factor YlaD
VTALAAAAVALALVPLTAAGVPVLASAGVALLVGALWPGQDDTEFPEVQR